MMEKEKLPILSVRYKIPTPRPNYIIREQLMESLEQMRENAVTVIKAGAGSGKTTLLSIYMKEKNPGHVRWITLDKTMNQAFLFWKYVFGALEEELTGHTMSLRNCFEGGLQKEMLEQILAALADSLQKEVPMYLILDDFQNLTDAYLLETFDLFISMMPDNLHLVLSSRQMPKINTGTLYMQGRLFLLDDEDLRISKEECLRFLTKTLGMNKEEGLHPRIQAIIEDANGWIGGAQLMAITGHEPKKVYTAFTSTDSCIIYDYIEKEIFTSLSREEQQFLLKTAVLSYFNEEICSQYLPEYNFSYMIKHISDKNLFVIHIDEENKDYRYHAILQEFLLHKLEENPSEKQDLYCRAAGILYGLQDYEECVRLLFTCRQYEILMKTLLRMPQNTSTFSYMMQVPREQIIKNPNFAYQYFFCYYAALEAEECEKIYHYIRQHLQKDETFQAFEHSNLFLDADIEFADIAILPYKQIASMPLNQISKAYLLIKEAYFLFMKDNIPDALQYLEQAEKIYRSTNNIYIEIFSLSEKTQILEEYGEYTKALHLYSRMQRLLTELPAMKCSYYIGIAGLHIRQLRLAEAKEELTQAKAATQCRGDALRRAYLYTLAEWHYVSGSPDKTEEILSSFAAEDVYQSVFFSARLLRYPVYRGQNRHLAKKFLEDYKKTDTSFRNMDTELLFIGIEYELGDKQEATALLDQLTARARKTGNKTKIIESALMKARFLYEQKASAARVKNLLIESIQYAAPEGIRLPFWFEKSFLTALQKDPAYQLTPSQRTFLGQSLTTGESAPLTALLPYNLTERELEVLQQISQGHSNKTIAENLNISLATVKTHLINIYGKLQVNNRLSAANKLTNFLAL